MTRAQGARAKMALAFETAYGVSPASGYRQVPFVSATLGAEQPLLNNEVLGFGRDPLEPARDALNADGNVVVPMDLENMGLWLKGTFGAPDSQGFSGATGQITFSAQPSVGSVVIINGVSFAFVASGATGNQVNIGASLSATLVNLATVLNASANASVSVATYTSDATHLIATFDTPGAAGNDFTLATGSELLTNWNDPRGTGWANQGITGANSAETFGAFTSAYALNSGTGGKRITPSIAVVPGGVYRCRWWFKATGDVRCYLTKQPGAVNSMISGPLGAPAAIASAAGVISNVTAQDQGGDVWLYQCDIEMAAGATDLFLGIGPTGSTAHAVTIFGASILSSSEATADPHLSGGSSSHTFESGAWDLPSMTIETQMPEVPKYALYPGVMVDQIFWEMRRSGLLQVTLKLIAQGEDIDTVSNVGSLAAYDYERLGHWNGAIKRNGVAIGNVMQGRFNYMNNLDRIDAIRDDGRIDGADPSIAACTGQIVVRFADMTLLQQAIDGDPCEFEFAHKINANKGLIVTVHSVYLPRPRTEIGGPGGIEVTFDWQASQTPDGGPMVTAVLLNLVEAY